MSSSIPEIDGRINAAIVARDVKALDRLLDEVVRPAKQSPSAFTPAIELRPRFRKNSEELAVEAGVEPEGDVAMGIANKISRAKRRIRYELKVISEFSGRRIVSEGDSWFQYPVKLRDIIDVLSEDDDKAILSLDSAGDEITQMADQRDYLVALAETRAQVLLLSAGGNDLLGEGRLAGVLKPFSNGDTPEQVVDEAALGAHIDGILTGYRKVLTDVRDHFASVSVLGHGYDLPHPLRGGKWLGKPLEQHGIPLPVGRAAIGIMLDRFNEALAGLSEEFPKFHHVDLRKKIDRGASSWHDELHPQNPGYARAAEEFRQAIARLGDRMAPEFAPSHVTSGGFMTTTLRESGSQFRDNFCCEGMFAESGVSKPNVDRFEPTTHQSSRNGTLIDHIVIHYTTSRSIEGTISWFKNAPAGKRTSAHYIVGRDGALVQMVNDSDSAWHAGVMNPRSIGIEHVAADGDEITTEQAITSSRLIAWLMQEYPIPKSNVIPHVCVKPTTCCGDLFVRFGGGANKSCDQQKAALHAWMASMSSGGPEAATVAAPSYQTHRRPGVDRRSDGERTVRGHSLLGEEPRIKAGSNRGRFIEETARDLAARRTVDPGNDSSEFSSVPIGDAPDLSSVLGNEKAARAMLETMISNMEFDGTYFNEFKRFFEGLALKHFIAAELLYLGSGNQSGLCTGTNALPPRELWPNIVNTARMLDRIRELIGGPIRILSAFRNEAYNACVGGAVGSHHRRFNAVDWTCSTGSVSQWRDVARQVRASDPVFTGGVGFYPIQGFIHIDTRGTISDW